MESKTINVSAIEHPTNEMIKNAISKLIAECLMDKEEDADFTKRLAISALQKRIPQKPMVNLWDEWCECPICEGAVAFEDIKYKFCPDCGQAIDWSE